MSGAVPKLRFPGFAGEWKPARAGDAFAKGAARGEPGLPIYSVTMDRGLVPRDSLDRHMGDDAADGVNLRAEAGDIVYNMMRMWQGAAGVADRSCMVSPAYVVLKPRKQTSAAFFNHWFENKRMLYKLGAYSHGLTSDRLRLYYDDFAKIPLHLPTLPEQEKIAGFLGAVDGKISELRRKEEGLNRFKAGLMQKLFSQELRFTRDDGSDFPDWQEKRLGDCVDLVSGQHLSPEDYNGDGKGLPYFTGPSDYTNDALGVTKWTTLRGAKIAKPGDTVITVKGSGVGELLQLSLSEVAMGRQLMAVRAAGTDGRLIFQILATLRHEFQARAAGNMIPGLSRDDILSLSVNLPKHPEEQRKIAEALSALDGKIAGVRAQITGLETFKKGLLQQMFV